MFKMSNWTNKHSLYSLFYNRWAISCLSVLLVQQIIEASTTIWLVKLMQSITRGDNFTPHLILCLSSLALAYIPQCIAFILKITWKQEAQRTFINSFVESNKNNINEWSNKGIKEQKLSVLTSEGPAAIHALIDYVWDLYTYVLSVFLNMMALSVILEPMFIITYGVSVVIVIMVMKFKRRAQRQLTQKALSARVDLAQSLLAAWDNVLLGNEYNFKLWENKTTNRLDRCVQRNVALERFDQFLAIVVSLITSVPSLLLVVYCVYIHRNNPVELSSFIVVLPLLFNNLSYTYQTLSLAFRWTMHRSKMTSIYKSIQASKYTPTSMEKKVQWPKIQVAEQVFSPDVENVSTAAPPQVMRSCHDLLQKASTSCRLTIRGDNGSGKSTMLMLVKKALEHRAFFLPTQNQLSFLALPHKHSTGEELKNRLAEIIDNVDVDVLLLDEWDANLDKENQERLSGMIDLWAQKKCVIEVRHR